MLLLSMLGRADLEQPEHMEALVTLASCGLYLGPDND